ncbi:hypothetical protein D3C78_963800 [compost metagenome]
MSTVSPVAPGAACTSIVIELPSSSTEPFLRSTFTLCGEAEGKEEAGAVVDGSVTGTGVGVGDGSGVGTGSSSSAPRYPSVIASTRDQLPAFASA